MDSSTKAKLIAIVDDDHSVLTSLGRLFRARGYRVATFQHGRDFLSAAEQNCFDCVLVDVYMVGLTGLDVLREVGTRLPCIAISGAVDDDMHQAATRAGACAYLTKPIDEDTLMACVDQCIAAHG